MDTPFVKSCQLAGRQGSPFRTPPLTIRMEFQIVSAYRRSFHTEKERADRVRGEAEGADDEVSGVAVGRERNPKPQVQTTNLGHWLGDPNLDLLHDLPVGIDLLHYHEIAGSAQPATRIRDVESRLISIRIEANS